MFFLSKSDSQLSLMLAMASLPPGGLLPILSWESTAELLEPIETAMIAPTVFFNWDGSEKDLTGLLW